MSLHNFVNFLCRKTSIRCVLGNYLAERWTILKTDAQQAATIATEARRNMVTDFVHFDCMRHWQIVIFDEVLGLLFTAFRVSSHQKRVSSHNSRVSSHKKRVLRFYSAMLCRARYCHGKSSVCPFICLSVALRCSDHLGWNTSRLISRMSLDCSLSARPNINK